jgi:hypothetical protein
MEDIENNIEDEHKNIGNEISNRISNSFLACSEII